MMVDALEQWLAQAARGLSVESIERVRAEITEHHRSAYDASIAEGASPSEANERAVAALGDPKSANRQYRRVLLTSWDAKFLQRISMDLSTAPISARQKRMGKLLAGVILAEAFAAMIIFASKYHAILWAFVPLVLFALLRPVLPITPMRCRIYQFVKWLAFLAGATLAAWFGRNPVAWTAFSILLWPAFWDYRRMLIRRKLPVDRWPKRLYR